MGGMKDILASATNLLSLTSSVTSLGMSLFGGGGKNISIPKLPKIPTPDYESLNAQIKANQGISEQARTAAIESLSSYNQGKLSPTYQSMYEGYLTQIEPQIKDMYSRIMQEMAARGFTQGSTEYNNAMNDLAMRIDANKAQYKNQLMSQQLNDAMGAAGLSETTMNDLYSKWSMQMGETQLKQANWQNQVYGRAMQSGLATERAAQMGQGLALAGMGLGAAAGGPAGATAGGAAGTTAAGTTASAPTMASSMEDWQNTMTGGVDLGDYYGTTV